ncbi:hypothetical protein BAR153v2_002260 [Bartonella sp. AR 15-3]|nr:hypothetical protein BAR153v2_002260 [Bartonella sp. AR 15-3]
MEITSNISFISIMLKETQKYNAVVISATWYSYN